jgi:hypothetical protein
MPSTFRALSRSLSRGFLAAGTLFALPATFAELLVYEGFDYTSEASQSGAPNLLLDELDGGLGWAGAWARPTVSDRSDEATVETGSLGYTDAGGYALETVGGHAYLRGMASTDTTSGLNTKVRRSFASTLGTGSGQTVYLSLLMERTGEAVDPTQDPWTDTSIFPNGYPYGTNLYPRGASAVLLESKTGFDDSIRLGTLSDEPVDQWSLIAESSHYDSGIPLSQSNFIVVRLDYGSESHPNIRGNMIEYVTTQATIWVNPEDLVKEDRGAGVRLALRKDLVDPFQAVLEGIGLEAGNDTYFRPVAELRADEIRIGETWDDVTPVVGGKPPISVETRYWSGLEVNAEGFVYPGERLGWLWIDHAPWVFSAKLDTWLYLPNETLPENADWFYALDLAD